MFYVYEWYVVESGEVFYVGKGTGRRYKVRKHNKFFNDFITRYNCESRIVREFNDEKTAFEYEHERVSYYKSIGQCVCNIYEGGLGGTVSWWNEELRDIYSKKNVMKSEEQRERMKNSNPMKNKEIAMKNGNSHKRKICIGDKIYSCARDIAEEFNVDTTAIRYWIQRGYAPNELPCYYYGDQKPKVVLRTHKSNERSVIIDGIEYKSIKDASEQLGLYSTNLGTALKKGKPTFNGHTIKYGNQQPSQGKSNNSTLKGSTTNG